MAWFLFSSYIFQLTTSRRGRRNTIKALLPPSYFNSRPREEVDVVSKVLDATCSSFQLTTSQGGRPLDNWWLDHIRCISTHDLTRRSTTSTGSMSDNSLFQLTTSRGGRRKSVLYPPFSGSFQLTTSQGGRPQLSQQSFELLRISTHDLARRSTFTATFSADTGFAFQLTTSRRGRRFCAWAKEEGYSFQLTTSRRGRRHKSTS